jgi:putative colanic acid biosynthesis acetyltransferase WcaF
MAAITLGQYATVSQGTHLCAGSHDINDENFQLIARPIDIGDYAWIAAEAFVGPGVVIGTGAVVGARCVVFSRLEPWTVYIGNPAEAVKARSLLTGAKGAT